jgi:anti-sigma regulatory factor (Ser/Thr protein kinase)
MTSPLQSPVLPSAVAAEQTYLQIPSQPEWIAPTVEYLKEKAILCGACHQARVKKLMLALHEALTNSVIHGNLELSSALKEQSETAFAEALAQRAADPHYGNRPVDVQVAYDGDRCQWIFTDQGKGFDVERVIARACSTDEQGRILASGRGILLMRAFVDEVRYEMGGRRAILTLLARPFSDEKGRSRRGRTIPRCHQLSRDC